MGRYRQLPDLYAPLAPRYAPLPKKADRFYQSKEWLALLGRLFRKRGRRCERCGAQGKDAQGKAIRILGDHIIERRDGGADLDEANIRLLCQDCHNGKTADAAARRVGLAGRGRA